jgi:hypothetical protein
VNGSDQVLIIPLLPREKGLGVEGCCRIASRREEIRGEVHPYVEFRFQIIAFFGT